ncbi:S-layer homology domain-containing protein [Vampirovibrio sp.]|uniref:S-layer homology domain-containing protein n=1 Tax=Vampirovibrio sp. TaxID=2717857 RepID=UPI0035935C4F
MPIYAPLCPTSVLPLKASCLKLLSPQVRFGLIPLATGFLMLNATVAYSATPFKDLPERYWANPAIQFLSERGVISGYADQSFQPNRPVTRAEFAVILAKSQGLNPSASGNIADHPGGKNFSDVHHSHWAANAIQAIVKQGWMSGYPNRRFHPNQILTMAEMYVILSKAQTGLASLSPAQADEVLRFYRDSDEIPAWARIPVAQAIESGITVTERSKTKLFPNSPAVRANVAISVAKLVNPALRDNKAEGSPQIPATQRSAPPAEDISAVNLVGVLENTPPSDQWILVRADGRRFPLSPGALDTRQWQAGQQVRITGNLNAVVGTAANPTVVVQTYTPIAPAVPPAVLNPAPEPAPVSSEPAAISNPQAAPISEPTPKPEANPKAEPSPKPSPESSTTTPAAELPTEAEMALPLKQDIRTPQLYFPNLANLVSDPALMLGEPVPRPAPEISTPRKAVEAILKGPTEAERRQGFFTDADLHRLNVGKLSIDPQGLATVTLEAPGDFQFSNSSVPARLSEQIRRTLTQFEGIQQVKVSVKNPKHKDLWISP